MTDFLTWPGGAALPRRDHPRSRVAGFTGACAAGGGGAAWAGGRETRRADLAGRARAGVCAATFELRAPSLESSSGADVCEAGTDAFFVGFESRASGFPAIPSICFFTTETPGRLPKPTIPTPSPTAQRQATSASANPARRSRRARRPSEATKIACSDCWALLTRSRSITAIEFPLRMPFIAHHNPWFLRFCSFFTFAPAPLRHSGAARPPSPSRRSRDRSGRRGPVPVRGRPR